MVIISCPALTHVVDLGRLAGTACALLFNLEVFVVTGPIVNCNSSTVQVWMLVDPSTGKTFPAFNSYPFSTPDDKLLGWTAAAPRNLHTSGCKLFAMSSYLRAGNLAMPTYNVTTKSWTPGDLSAEQHISGVTTNYPRLFLHFLWDYVLSVTPSLQTRDQASQDTSTGLFLHDPEGAIAYGQTLIDAITLLQRNQSSPATTQFALGPLQPVSVAEGTEIADLSNSILTGNPVLTGVGNTGSAHVVLIVGMVKNAGKTYYITTDSGFPPMDPNQANPKGSQPKVTPVRAKYKWADIQPFTISTCSVSEHFTKIFWYQTVYGVGQMTCVASSSVT